MSVAAANQGTTAFDPYGGVLGVSGTQSVFGFQSDVTDALTKQVDMGTRWYAPSQGRFSTRDVLFGSLTSPIGMNQWLYAGANPLTMHDPTGMLPVAGNEATQDDADLYSEASSSSSSWGSAVTDPDPVIQPAPTPIGEYLDLMNDPDLSWEERTAAAEGLLSDHPRLGPDLVDGWITETLGGHLPEYGIMWRPEAWKPGTRIWWIVRALVNVEITREWMGLATGSGGVCALQKHAFWVCTVSETSGLFRGGGTTYGNAFITDRDPSSLSRQLLGHEMVHATQWTRYGVALIDLYWGEYIQMECNFLEEEAGFRRGEYDHCI